MSIVYDSHDSRFPLRTPAREAGLFQRESLHRPHQDGLSGVRRIVPCTNLNIDILKGQVI